MDDEYHLLANCGSFVFKRNYFFSKYAQVHPGIKNMPEIHTILCSTTTTKAKLVNKYIQILFDTRQKIDEGFPMFNLGYERGIAPNQFFDIDNDNIDESP